MRYINGRWISAPKRKDKAYYRRRRLGRIVAVAVSILLLMVFVSEFALHRLTPELTETVSQKYVADAVSDSVNRLLDEQQAEVSFSLLSKDSAGKIISLETDTESLNRFKMKLSKQLQEKLNGETTAYVPIGSFFDVALLNGRGFSVPVKLNFDGAADIRFQSTFESAGVNQTCHRIVLSISVKAVSQSNLFSANADYTTDMILSETIIVGEVPQFIARTSEY